MKVDSITRILDAVTGVRKDGVTYLIPEELEVSFYFALGSEVLTLNRVARLQPGADVLTIEAAKGERYFFPPEHLAGIKVGVPEAKGPRATGFR